MSTLSIVFVVFWFVFVAYLVSVRLLSRSRRATFVPFMRPSRGVYCYGRRETERRKRRLARGIIHTN